MNRPSEPLHGAIGDAARESEDENSIAGRIRRQLLDEVVRERLMSSDLTTYARRGTY
ncbi:MAG: hypothetical protein HIU84_05835 [Acidobacteria bacterium]|nr:hypothetical protein [Acidobacteriota bacterium]